MIFLYSSKVLISYYLILVRVLQTMSRFAPLATHYMYDRAIFTNEIEPYLYFDDQVQIMLDDIEDEGKHYLLETASINLRRRRILGNYVARSNATFTSEKRDLLIVHLEVYTQASFDFAQIEQVGHRIRDVVKHHFPDAKTSIDHLSIATATRDQRIDMTRIHYLPHPTVQGCQLGLARSNFTVKILFN